VLGIVVAMAMERRWIVSDRPPPLIEQSGIGDRRAEAAARDLVDQGATALASWGTAGGLDPGLGPGTVVIPSSVVVTDSIRYESNSGWHARLTSRLESVIRPETGPILHVERAIATPGQKRELHERFGVLAVDMESGAVARVAAQYRLPFIAVRVVLDGAGVRLPMVALIGPDGFGASPAQTMLWRIARSPREWRAVFRLARCFRTSGAAMKRVWQAAAPDLGLTAP
jgi:hypothetical protein